MSVIGTPALKSNEREVTSAAYWDTWWARLPVYEPIRPNDCQYGRNGYFLRLMERLTGRLERKSVLELGGCVSNRLLSMAKWRSASAAVLDYSQVGLQRTGEFFERNGCAVELIKGDFYETDFDGRKFDLVTHWGVMEHQTDPYPLLSRCADLLAPYGKIIFTMPNLRAPGALGWKYWWPDIWKLHIFHSKRVIQSAATAAHLHCKSFHYGAPFVHNSPAAMTSSVGRTLEALQWSLSQCGRFLPYEYGMPGVSEHRGFVMCREGVC